MVNLFIRLMSPYNFNSGNANVFYVNGDNGNLNGNDVNNTTPGVRPISFYNLHIWLRLNIIELGYKINQRFILKI